jgi:CheY-like chemotaxis protein
MSRILLADDSRHAQNMGELILRDEGFDVVCAGDGETVMQRLGELDPDIILADAFLPKRSGYDLCREIKNDPRFRHVRVVLTAGILEPLDETEAARAGCDALLKKPFEASVVIETLKPLAEEARVARDRHRGKPVEAQILPGDVDPEAVRAAVTIALDAALPAMVDEITERVLAALRK